MRLYQLDTLVQENKISNDKKSSQNTTLTCEKFLQCKDGKFSIVYLINKYYVLLYGSVSRGLGTTKFTNLIG